MSSTQSIDQKLAKLILAPGQEAIPLPGLAASPDSLKKKVGPAPPPKVKKAQPQVATISKRETQHLNRTGITNTGPVFPQNTYSNVVFPPPPPPPAYPGTQNTYSNINNYNAVGDIRATDGVDEDLPPPPPLPDQGTYTSDSSVNFPPPPPEEFMSPPSPVSSSYSELRKATGQGLSPKFPPPYGAGYVTYQAPSDSSNYESLYEPLNPRPPSEMSSRGSYSLYGPFGPQGLAPHPSTQPVTNPEKRGREAEVDALTNMLIRGMDESSDPDFYGMCAECGSKIAGEGNGCTAMGSFYHIKCFVCVVCRNTLREKPFYDVDGKPHCHDCYMETLEKCNVCMKPILERILRATGKPYHPKCFTCTICKKCLDNVPFTVDASNQVYCIDDFHRKFAPRCSVCKEPIMPEPGKDETIRVVALDRSFHVQCYRCEDCGLVLSSEAEGRGCYPLDGHVLCKNCNCKRIRALTTPGSTEL
ncbi:lipoma-preferred partner homolog isoform X2 [Artemia franciscana]|uniref:LIM zinc-binding domain-containing protein n=2 Tax=Artemia franciscana TaxID=6661 RepID=A0AA88HAP8_ARTSF|nr:hypothetical protein QYM36_015779 [Artemia franciscana]